MIAPLCDRTTIPSKLPMGMPAGVSDFCHHATMSNKLIRTNSDRKGVDHACVSRDDPSVPAATQPPRDRLRRWQAAAAAIPPLKSSIAAEGSGTTCSVPFMIEWLVQKYVSVLTLGSKPLNDSVKDWFVPVMPEVA